MTDRGDVLESKINQYIFEIAENDRRIEELERLADGLQVEVDDLTRQLGERNGRIKALERALLLALDEPYIRARADARDVLEGKPKGVTITDTGDGEKWS